MEDGMTLLAVWAIFGAIGGAIGSSKNKVVYGVVTGFLLGPLGWILAAVTPSAMPKCPDCKGDIVPGAKKCKNCGTTLGN